MLYVESLDPHSLYLAKGLPSSYIYLAYCGIMPRDLFISDSKDDSLVASPRPSTPTPDRTEVATATGNDGYREFTIHRDESTDYNAHQLRGIQVKANDENNLHPYVQTLSLSDLESCVALENAVFPEHERCSREKVDIFSDSILVRIFRSRLCQKKSHCSLSSIPLTGVFPH